MELLKPVLFVVESYIVVWLFVKFYEYINDFEAFMIFMALDVVVGGVMLLLLSVLLGYNAFWVIVSLPIANILIVAKRNWEYEYYGY